eukprot:13165534-Ditylum_brightwellii.AAC.1
MDKLGLSFGRAVNPLSMYFPLPGLGYCILKNVHQVVLCQFHLRSSVVPRWELLQTVIHLVDVQY